MRNNIETHDVYIAAYLDHKSIAVDFRLAPTGRVVFLLPVKKEVHELIAEFNTNPQVPLLDYIQSLRKIRARMIAMRS